MIPQKSHFTSGDVHVGTHGVCLAQVADSLVASGKGILAADESIQTCNKRFQALGIPATEETRRAYRELLFTAPGLRSYISGAIVCDETMRQTTSRNVRFVDALQRERILVGIKVDTGTESFPGSPDEKITTGLDGLAERIAEYRALGARFAKWRAVIAIGENRPSQHCIEANAYMLARYARICQEGGLVPIVEPEVLMDGSHDLARCAEVTVITLAIVFEQLDQERVWPDEMILKPSMVIEGSAAPLQSDPRVVAAATVTALKRTVPSHLAGIAFLSGGQSALRATENLHAITRLAGESLWPLTFSFGRALQSTALEYWRGADDRVVEAQRKLVRRARCNAAAALGMYEQSMEEGARQAVPA